MTHSMDEVLDKIPLLRDPSRQVADLPGGLTNRNYKVSTTHGAYVVRVSSSDADLLSIDRHNEHHNAVAAAAAGVGAPVVAFLPEEGVLVVEFINGHTLVDEDLGRPGSIDRLAHSCRRLHAGPRFVNAFDMFDIYQGYLRLVQGRGFRLPGDYLEFLPQVEQVRRALMVRAEGTVPCNNDLLAANFIDDGQQIWLIDYEYSGNNDACFELGNIWSECHLDPDQLDSLVQAYYGRPIRNKLARCRLQGLMSQYGWTLWASIQQAVSPLDFDFWSWGLEKYDRAVQTFGSAEFAVLLDDVQRVD